MLVLKVENFDRLGDGGPLHYEANRRGFDFGRDQHLDWTLPDPTRKVSGKHCTVLFEKGGYYLYDVSSNGTFVNGTSRRVQSPYELQNGDELAIGDYIISVTIEGEIKPNPQFEPRLAVPGPAGTPSDVWGSVSHSVAPIKREDLMPQQMQPRSEDFLSRAVSPLPQVPPAASWDPPALAAPPRDPWAPSIAPARPREQAGGWPVPSQPQIPPPSAPPPPNSDMSHQASHWPAQGGDMSIAKIVREVPFPAARPQPQSPAMPGSPVAAPPQQVKAPAGPPPEAPRVPLDQDFIRRFAQGANIPAALLASRSAGDFAFEMGELFRLVCANLMQLLKARAEMKAMVRTSDRTMIEARENNALKFTPTPEAALSIMFGQPAAGYLDARTTIERSFGDIKAHEAATYSAMQQALLQLVEELSPAAVEQASGGGKLGFLSGKSRHWELFVERWNAKVGDNEHGMLDAFLDEFAAHYEAAIPKRR